MEYLTDPCKQRAKAREEGQSENVAQEFSELMRVDGGRSECTLLLDSGGDCHTEVAVRPPD